MKNNFIVKYIIVLVVAFFVAIHYYNQLFSDESLSDFINYPKTVYTVMNSN